jgi:hypothetical protein
MGTVDLILGKTSTTIRGLQVYPGVIDETILGKLR